MNSGNTINKEKIKQKLGLEKIKNNFILKKIFGYVKKIKYMEIIKYNKKLQKRLNLSFDGYQEYSQLYSSIIVELKLVDNKYIRFINIPYTKKEYYHIYFDNSKEEIKRNYLNENEKVKIIKIKIDHQVTSFQKLFSYCDIINSIIFKKFSRNNITDMSYMFSGCSSLKELTLSNFNTNNVTNMSGMFSGCSLLTKLNASKFNTYNVTDMSHMFSGCSSLKELNLSKFNTNNVINMSYMFSYCSSLKQLIISNFNMNNVNHIFFMFDGCSNELIEKIKEQNKNIKIE